MYKLAIAFVLTLLVAAPLAAADKPAKKAEKKAQKKEAAAVTAVEKELAALDLSAEQSKKVKELTDEYGPKLSAAQNKIADLLSPEQKKARVEAAAKAKAEGAKGEPLAQSVKAALKLSPDQEKGFDAANTELKDAVLAYRKAVADVLTPEQLAKTKLANAKKAKKVK